MGNHRFNQRDRIFGLSTNSTAQIKQDLAKIGIQVDFTPLAWNTLTDKLSNSLEWESALLGLTGGNEPNDGANVWAPEGGLHMFNQKPLPGETPVDGQTFAPWEKKIGQFYIEGARELDSVKRKAIYDESQRLTQEYLPFIYLVNPYSMSAVRNRIQGIKFSAIGGAFWNIHELTLVDKFCPSNQRLQPFIVGCPQRG